MAASAPHIDQDDVARILMLAFGNMEQGGMYWCYVAVKPSRYPEFKTALAGKKYNIQNYEKDGFGEVIVSGVGALPPQEVSKQVAALYGIPVKELFDNVDPMVAIKHKIEKIKGDTNSGH